MSLTHTQALLTIMARLRDRETGCPWDVEQNFATIAPYTIEEAYEVEDAIRKGDMAGLKEELGDLLLQVVFHTQMAKEAGLFDFDSVAETIGEKMRRRHPHVFGEADIRSAQAQTENWEKLKAKERGEKSFTSILADIPLGLPALTRAEKLQKRAARAGFDWPDMAGVRAKITEELAECDAAIEAGDKEKIAEEIGDLLFAVTNLARFLGCDAEAALRATNHKFITRFQYIEQALRARGRIPETSSLEEMETLWQEAKKI